MLALLVLHASTLCWAAHVRRIRAARKIEVSLSWRGTDGEVPNTRSPWSRWILLLACWHVGDCNSVDVLFKSSVRCERWVCVRIMKQIIHLYNDLCKLRRISLDGLNRQCRSYLKELKHRRGDPHV